MIYSAVGLAVTGAAAGLAFRWKVLLPIILILPVAVIIFSRGLGFADTAIAIIVAEAILQGGYFAGLLLRFMATAISGLFKSRRDSEVHGKDRRTAPPAEAPKGS